jgi:hypothetical protein
MQGISEGKKASKRRKLRSFLFYWAAGSLFAFLVTIPLTGLSGDNLKVALVLSIVVGPLLIPIMKRWYRKNG